MKSFKLMLLCVLALLAAGTGLFAYTPDSTTTHNLADGLVYKKYTYNNLYGGYQEVFVLEVDLSNPSLEVGIGLCQNNVCQNTATQGKNNNAYAAVNLGFFNMVSGPTAAVGLIKANGKLFRGAGGYPTVTAGYLWVDKLRAGVVPEDSFATGMADNLRWCYPVLLQKGTIYPPLANFVGSDYIITQSHSRTAVGVTSSRQKMYIVIFDKYTTGTGPKLGVSCKNLADYMLSLGCYEAINMDGGGSSTMWTSAYGLMNRPTGGTYQRPVYDTLFVRARQSSHPETSTSNPTKPNPGGMDKYTPKGER